MPMATSRRKASTRAGLPVLGDKWRDENPYRTNALAQKIGASAYGQNCARCHGLEAVSGGIAPDLRQLDRDCVGMKNAAKKTACFKEMDNYLPDQRTLGEGAQRRGLHAALRRRVQPGSDVGDQDLSRDAPRNQLIDSPERQRMHTILVVDPLRVLAAFLMLAALSPARADWNKIQGSGALKVAVYNEFAPFSDKGAGIDVDLAQALAARLGLKLNLMPFPADEEVGDDLRNMVWKGHYLGYGPADVMLHVPVDNRLMNDNPQVRIFAPYYVETLRLVRSERSIPRFDDLDALAGKRIGVEKVSIAGMLMLGEGNGRFREQVRIFPSAGEALLALKEGELDAVLAKRAEIEAVMRGDPAFPLERRELPAPAAFRLGGRHGGAQG